jgi:hypothetical protein
MFETKQLEKIARWSIMEECRRVGADYPDSDRMEEWVVAAIATAWYACESDEETALYREGDTLERSVNREAKRCVTKGPRQWSHDLDGETFERPCSVRCQSPLATTDDGENVSHDQRVHDQQVQDATRERLQSVYDKLDKEGKSAWDRLTVVAFESTSPHLPVLSIFRGPKHARRERWRSFRKGCSAALNAHWDDLFNGIDWFAVDSAEVSGYVGTYVTLEPTVSTYARDTEGLEVSGYEVSGYVEVQNAYGAKITLTTLANFVCAGSIIAAGE